MERFAYVLRVKDVLVDGASVKQMVEAFYRPERAREEGGSDGVVAPSLDGIAVCRDCGVEAH